MHNIAPFWQSQLAQSLDFFKGQTESRYSICQKACQILLLEFFADEEGHIVVKIPNWILGSNFLRMNNCNILYYDDVRYTELPTFIQNEDGSIGVQPAKSQDNDSDDSDGISGWLSNIFENISNALGNIFSTLLSGKSDENSVTELPPGQSSEAKPTYDIPYIRQILKDGIKRAGGQTPMEKIKGFFDKLFSFENNEEEVDYTYAGLTDDIIKDILDKNNDSVVQIDEYKFKLQIKNIHDNKYGSLYSIAKYCYGNIYKWHIIAELNNIYEPTEIHEGQWLGLYSNEPISDFIINSSDIDNIEIQELKYLRQLQLKQLYKTNNNEITVSNCPFIKGEFISYPTNLQNKHNKINFTNNITTKLTNKKKFFIPKNKIHSNEFNLTKKIIHCNEEIINKISKASAYINNGYILDNYHEEYDNVTSTWKVILTIPNDIEEAESNISENYILSEYNPANNYEVILTITEDKLADDESQNNDKYILSEYKENKNSTNTEIILTISDKKSTIIIPDHSKDPHIQPIPIEHTIDRDHSTIQEKIIDGEMPKLIPHDTISTNIEIIDPTGIQHEIPQQEQPGSGQVTDNLGPDKSFERRVARAAKERSAHAKAVAQRINSLDESINLGQIEDLTEDDLRVPDSSTDSTDFRSKRTDII